MFEVGQLVMHPVSGVCCIDGFQEEVFEGKTKTFYVIHPMEKPERTTLYVSVESTTLRKILDKDEIIQVLKDSVGHEIPWIDNNNVRKATYNEILREGETSKIVALISRLHRQKEKVAELGKKFPVTDERIMKDAEKRIHQEFSYALRITEKEIPEYVISHLKKYRGDME